jgi:hypothetical protein
MKRNKSKLYIIVLMLIMFFFAIGYAIFSNTLNISGTAATTGNFDIQFFTATVDAANTSGVTPTATISGDKKTLTISAPDLAAPGSKAEIDVVVKNVGNVNAILKTINSTGTSDVDILISAVPTFTPDTALAAGATYEFSIKIEWSSSSTTGSKNVPFTFDLTYEQSV